MFLVFILLALLTLSVVVGCYWRVLKTSQPRSGAVPPVTGEAEAVPAQPLDRAWSDTLRLSNKSLAWLLSVVLPLVALGLYLKYGAPQAFDVATLAQQKQVTPEELQQVAQQLDDKLATEANYTDKNISRAQAYGYLGKIRASLGQWQQAKEAFVKSLAIEEDLDIEIQLAQSIAELQQGVFDGEPWKIIQAVLGKSPNHLAALWLAGQVSYLENKHLQAIEYWEKAKTQVTPADEVYGMLQQSLQEARQSYNNQSQAFISGTLSVDKNLLKNLSGEQFVFIYALLPNQTSGMPLAVKRIPLKELPYTFRLDDNLSLTPKNKLSQVQEVQLVARIAKSDKIEPQSDDWGVRLQNIKLGQENLQLVIRKKLSEY